MNNIYSILTENYTVQDLSVFIFILFMFLVAICKKIKIYRCIKYNDCNYCHSTSLLHLLHSNILQSPVYDMTPVTFIKYSSM